MRSTYFIIVKTGEQCEVEQYTEQAELLLSLTREVLTDMQKLRVLTKYNDIQSIHLDIEASIDLDEDTKGLGLVTRTVVDIEASKKVGLDKKSLTQFLRTHHLAENWKGLQVEKRLVTET